MLGVILIGVSFSYSRFRERISPYMRTWALGDGSEMPPPMRLHQARQTDVNALDRGVRLVYIRLGDEYDLSSSAMQSGYRPGAWT